MTDELDEVLRIKDEVEDFIDDNYEGEEVLRLLTALSMLIVDIGYDAEIEHMEIVKLFVKVTNHHIAAVSGPTEEDAIH
jgi:hypothetical protein